MFEKKEGIEYINSVIDKTNNKISKMPNKNYLN